MAEAYTDRDGRSYDTHGIEPTLNEFEPGDEIYINTENEAHAGFYTYTAHALDPDFHITLENENGRTCGIRRSVTDRDTLLFVPGDKLLAETSVQDISQTMSIPGTDTPQSPGEPNNSPTPESDTASATDEITDTSEVTIDEDNAEVDIINETSDTEDTSQFGDLEPEMVSSDDTHTTDETTTTQPTTSENQLTVTAFATTD